MSDKRRRRRYSRLRTMILYGGVVAVMWISLENIIRIYRESSDNERLHQIVIKEYVTYNIPLGSADISGEADTESATEAGIPELRPESAEVVDPVTEEDTEDDPNAWYHYIEVDIEGLKKVNSDIAGWIFFESGNEISYPLLYAPDDRYINMNYLGKSEKAGSIFIDKNCTGDMLDAHTIIFGHDMKDRSMFGSLKYFKNVEGYYAKNKYFQIITEDKIYRYEIFAFKDVDVLKGGVFTVFREPDREFTDFVRNELLSRNYVTNSIDPASVKRVVTLATCSVNDSVRFVVSASLVGVHKR